MKRSLLLTLGALAGTAILAVALVGFRLLQGGLDYNVYAHIADYNADTTADMHAEIDADISDGACTDVDFSKEVGPGVHQVAVCVSSATASVGTFNFTLNYDPALDTCPDILSGAGDSLDDNPDVNQAALGGGWDCNIFDLAEPTCQVKNEAGDPQPGKAWMACWSLTGPYSSPTGDVTWPLATVTLNAIAFGVENLTLSDLVLSDSGGVEFGSCNPVSGIEITCESALIVKVTPTVPPPQTDLSVTLVGAPASVVVGNPVVWTATVDNLGAYDADAVELVVTLPASKPYVSDDSGCTEAAGVVTCDIGALAVADPAVVVNITTGSTTLGVSTATASVSEADGAPGEIAPANNTASADVAEVSSGVRMEKDCSPAEGVQTNCNLWVKEGETVPAEGKGCLSIEKWVFNAVDGDSTNDSDEEPEGLGAWEERILWDHKILTVDAVPDVTWLESGGRIANCSVEIITENWIKTSCVTLDDPAEPGQQPGPNGDGLIEVITVCPQVDDLIGIGLRPTKDNGIVTDLIDDNCEITDYLAEWIPGTSPGGETATCGDARITVRILQGDLDLDCDVDVVDEQAIAFRFGAFLGLQLYDQWWDLEPKWTDYDIDIKDLQFVFGRDGSTCQAPLPDDQAVPLP